MKNIESKTICSKRTPHFVIFMVQNERQLAKECCASLFIAFMIIRRYSLFVLIGWYKFIVLLQIIDMAESQHCQI